jgi:transposase-like protein
MPSFLGPLERLELIRDGFYSPDRRQHTRAAALMALDRGLSMSRVARSVKCDRDTLYRWRDRYLEIRSPAALQDGRGRAARRAKARRRAPRAAALVALAAARGRVAEAPGRLRLDPAAQQHLARLAAGSPDLTRRYRAALLWAYDRACTITDIARVAGIDRHTVYQAPARHLARVLGGDATPTG